MSTLTLSILELAGLGLTFWIVSFAFGASSKLYRRMFDEAK